MKRAVFKRNTNDSVLGGYYRDLEGQRCQSAQLFPPKAWLYFVSVALKYRGVDGGILSWLVSVISDDQVPSWDPCHTHSVTGGEGQDCQIQILRLSTVFYDLISQT